MTSSCLPPGDGLPEVSSFGLHHVKGGLHRRTKDALTRKRAEGIVLGRPKGRKSDKVKLSGQENKIIMLLQNRVPKTKIAKICGVHRMTIDAFIKNRLLSN